MDGYTSASILYQYIKRLNPDYPLSYLLHKNNKCHGMSKMLENDFDIPEDMKLLLVPDAGSNDIEQHKWLKEHNIDCICIDHHDISVDISQSPAIIVNNQASANFKAKEWSGCGVTYNFLTALDDYFICSYADDYLDVVSWAQIADMIDIKCLQTRYYIEKGLKQINNKFMLALGEAQSFSTKGIIDIHNLAWYYTPPCNAVCRCGSMEERDLMFKAFIQQDAWFDYKTRSGEIIQEDIYTRMARLAKNIKSKQDRMRDTLFNELKDKINLDDKIPLLCTDNPEENIIGLSAMKVAEYVHKPCIVVNSIDDETLAGSCRNCNGSPVKDLKELILSTQEFIFCNGHPGAAGLSLYKDNLEAARTALNKAAENIIYDPTIYVDFILDTYDLDYEFIKIIDDSKWLYGQGIEEPKIAVKSIEISADDIAVMGKDNNAIAFMYDSIKYCAFKLEKDNELLNFAINGGEDTIMLDVVGTCSLNEYQGRTTAQFIISDYNINTTE